MLFTSSCVLLLSYKILYNIPIATGARCLSRTYVYAPHGRNMIFFTAFFGAPAHFFQATCHRPIAPHSSVPLANYSPLHNSLLPPLAALSVIPTNHITPFPLTSQPLHPARSTLFIPQSASRWRPARKSTLLTATDIALHYIPNVTAVPFPILFSRNPIFTHFFIFFGAPKGLSPTFSAVSDFVPPSDCTAP